MLHLQLNGTAGAPQHDCGGGATHQRTSRHSGGQSQQQEKAQPGGIGGRVGAGVGEQHPSAGTHSTSTSSEAAVQQLFAVSLRSALMRLPDLTGERKIRQVSLMMT